MVFCYIKPPLIIYTPWIRPTIVSINTWLGRFLSLPCVNKYDVYISGGVIDHLDHTWDIDINLLGSIDDIDELENIILEGTRIGFDMNLLLDIQHHQYLDTGLMPIYNKMEGKRTSVDVITLGNITIKNGKVLSYWSDAKRISKNLWKTKMIKPGDKHSDRILSGDIISTPILIQQNSSSQKKEEKWHV